MRPGSSCANQRARPIGRLALVLLLLLVSLPARPGEIAGTVVKVIDGDTVEVLAADRTISRIRLAGIDAPERGQPFGTQAKRRLLDLVGGQPVKGEWHKRDRYGRFVGTLVRGGQDVNLAMVSSGLAWWYRKYADEQPAADRARYEQAERAAKAAHLGLWRDPDPTPPWEWRHRPPPQAGYEAACPCSSGKLCTGPHGGWFCVRESGSRKYLSRDP